MEVEFNQLVQYLSQFHHIPESEKGWLREFGKLKHISKKTHILKAGELQTTINFNCLGLFKYYYIDLDGNGKIKYFCDENQFAFSLSAFLTQSPSLFFIQAMEDATQLTFPAENLHTMVQQNPFWQQAFHKILVDTLLKKEKREADFLMLTAAQRYQKLLEAMPSLLHRVKQHDIAEYLGINPVHLSRIRAKTAAY